MTQLISVFDSVLGNSGSLRPIRARKTSCWVPKLPILLILGNLVFAFLGTQNVNGQATGNTTIQPDCLIPFTLTATGTFPATSTDNGAGDNRTKGCAAWTLMYQSTGFSAVSIQLNSGASPTTTVTYGAFAGTISSGFSNPLTSTTGGSLQAKNGTAVISWVQVSATLTGTGTVSGVLYGSRNSSASVNGGVWHRTCIISNDTQSATALTAAQFSGNGCVIPTASTIVEVDVTGGTGTLTGTPAAPTYTGTSSIQIGKTGSSSSTGLLSGALATVAGKACAKTSTSQACILNGVTSSNSITVSTTALGAGDELYVTAATPDTTQTWYAIAVIYTVN